MTNHKKMDFFIENYQLREDLQPDYPNGVYTLDLIRDGKRIATTREEPLGKVGEQILLYNSKNPNCEAILVEITDVVQLDIRTDTDAENWSRKEGWSVDYLKANNDLLTKYQTTFTVVAFNTEGKVSEHKQAMERLSTEESPSEDALLEEYKSCDELSKHIDQMIWQLATLVFPIALAGLTFFGVSITHNLDQFIILIIVAIGSASLLLVWYFLSNQWADYQKLTYYRMREIEAEINLWHYRYAYYAGRSQTTRAKIIAKSKSYIERERYKLLENSFGLIHRFGYSRTRKTISTIFILGWIALIVREIVLIF